MVTPSHVEEQLRNIGCNFRFVGRAEIKELPAILLPDEVIAACTNGRYAGGGALLVATNHRLLLIDRKPMFLTLEDIRYDMIAEMDYSARLLNSTVSISTPSRKLTFHSWNQVRLRSILTYTQQRVMEVRQHYMMQQFQPAASMPNTQQRASLVGGLALQGNNTQHILPTHPYMNMPILMRRRRYPKFY